MVRRRRGAYCPLFLVVSVGAWAGSGWAEEQGPPTMAGIVGQVAATTAKVEAALEKRVTTDFHETPLNDVLEFLRDYTGVNVVVYAGSLMDAGIDLDLPISLGVKDVSLRSALELLLEPLRLVAVVRDEVLLITDRCSAVQMLELVVYPVGDLVVVKGAKEYTIHGDHLADLIRATLAPETWEDGGGSGRIAFEPLTLSLVVKQAQAGQREIKTFLQTLRATKQAMGTGEHRGSLPTQASLEVAVERHLAKPKRAPPVAGPAEPSPVVNAPSSPSPPDSSSAP